MQDSRFVCSSKISEMLGEPVECFPRADFNTRIDHGVTNLARRMDNCIRKRSLPVFFDEGHRVDGFTSSNDSVDSMRSDQASAPGHTAISRSDGSVTTSAGLAFVVICFS